MATRRRVYILYRIYYTKYDVTIVTKQLMSLKLKLPLRGFTLIFPFDKIASGLRSE